MCEQNFEGINVGMSMLTSWVNESNVNYLHVKGKHRKSIRILY